MQHSPGMHVGKAAGNIVRPSPQEALLDTLVRLLRVVDLLSHVPSGSELHDDVQVIVVVEVLVVFDQVWVVE